MKSGAYLVIQPTEALTVIDVNSGKCLKKNSHFPEINREAAKEAAEAMAKEKKIEFAKDLLAEGESIERTVRLSKLSEAEVRELASKLTA